jgi:anti-anti-sigma factor
MLKVRYRKFGTAVILCLQGPIVINETPGLRGAVERQANVSVVVLDLSGVSLIDAFGLGLLLELREEIKSKRIEFRLMNPTERVRRLLQMTRLDSVFEIVSPAQVLSINGLSAGVSVKELAACA